MSKLLFFPLLSLLTPFLQAAEPEKADKGLHTPYTVCQAIRIADEELIVIPVQYYWKKGKDLTSIKYDMQVIVDGKSYPVRLEGTFMTESSTGMKSTVNEFKIYHWAPDPMNKDKMSDSLKTADEVKVRFTGTADGVEQTVETTVKIADVAPVKRKQAVDSEKPEINKASER